MTDIEKIKLTHPYLRRAKVLLMLLAISLFIADIMLLIQTNHLANSYTEQRNQTTWLMFQLSKEFSELIFYAEHYGHGENELANIWQKYELTWSRFDLLIYNEEANNFLTIDAARVFFNEQFLEFKALEPLLENVPESNSAAMETFHVRANEIYLSVTDYVNGNFPESSPLYVEQRSKTQALADADLFLVLGFVICIVLLWYVYSKESEYTKKLALTDPLTNIFNRLALFSLLENYEKTQQKYTLFLLDLNGFKQINDNYGHHIGDEVLIEVSTRLRKLNKHDCIAFRIGGDEFALVLKEISSFQSRMGEFGNKVASKFHRPFQTDGLSFSFSTSIGYASYPKDSRDIDELILIADRMMYRMKHENKKTPVNTHK